MLVHVCVCVVCDGVRRPLRKSHNSHTSIYVHQGLPFVPDRKNEIIDIPYILLSISKEFSK